VWLEWGHDVHLPGMELVAPVAQLPSELRNTSIQAVHRGTVQGQAAGLVFLFSAAI